MHIKVGAWGDGEEFWRNYNVSPCCNGLEFLKKNCRNGNLRSLMLIELIDDHEEIN